MSLPRLTSLLMIVLGAVACDPDTLSGPPVGFAHSVVTPACVGPLGETGVAIYLAHEPIQSLEPGTPHVRIYIRQPVERLTDQSWTVAGSAWYHSTATNPEIAASGQVTVYAIGSDNTIDGWADLTFPGGGRVGGNFRARWLPRTLGCL